MQSLPSRIFVPTSWGSVPDSTPKSGEIQKIKQLDRPKQTSLLVLDKKKQQCRPMTSDLKPGTAGTFFISGDKTAVSFHQWWCGPVYFSSPQKAHLFIPSSWLSFPVFMQFSIKGASSGVKRPGLSLLYDLLTE